MKQRSIFCCTITALAVALSLSLSHFSHAQTSVPATQPATSASTQAIADSPEASEARKQLLAWDDDVAKMSLFDYRKTLYTENDREAVYADWFAHDTWEVCKTEAMIRKQWGPDGDRLFARLMGFTTREEDLVCEMKVDGNHATASWKIDGVRPETLIKVDGKWMCDMHSMFDEWLKEDPQMETNHRSVGLIMKQARTDVDSGKFEDAESFIKDLQPKVQAVMGGN